MVMKSFFEERLVSLVHKQLCAGVFLPLNHVCYSERSEESCTIDKYAPNGSSITFPREYRTYKIFRCAQEIVFRCAQEIVLRYRSE